MSDFKKSLGYSERTSRLTIRWLPGPWTLEFQGPDGIAFFKGRKADRSTLYRPAPPERGAGESSGSGGIQNL